MKSCFRGWLNFLLHEKIVTDEPLLFVIIFIWIYDKLVISCQSIDLEYRNVHNVYATYCNQILHILFLIHYLKLSGRLKRKKEFKMIILSLEMFYLSQMCTELTFVLAITCLGGSFLVRKIDIRLCFGAINLDILGGKPHHSFLILFIINFFIVTSIWVCNLSPHLQSQSIAENQISRQTITF